MSASQSTSTAIDLSRLPPPAMVETLDYGAIRDEIRAWLVAELPEIASMLLESDPAMKLVEAIAWREMVLRQRINDAGRAGLVAFAGGADLDNLAALLGIGRAELAPAIGTTPAAMEPDDEFRRRIVLGPEGFSVAGPRNAYVFHALTAHPAIADACATSPSPGEVVVAVLARASVGSGDGTANLPLIEAVNAVVNADDIRPLTDHVTVQSAQILPFAITSQLTLYAGVDASLIEATARAALLALLGRSRRIGRDITRSAIIASLHVEGVQNVALTGPATDVLADDTQAAHCTDITLNLAVYAE